MHCSFNTARNPIHHNGDRRARDGLEKKVKITIKTRAVLVLERHPELKTGYHTHIKLPDMGGRTNVMIGCTPEAGNKAERIWYIFHDTEKLGCPPLIKLDPAETSRKSRDRLYKIASRLLGSRETIELRQPYGGEKVYSLLTTEELERQ